MTEWTFNKITCSYWTYVEKEGIWITGQPIYGDLIWINDTDNYRFQIQ